MSHMEYMVGIADLLNRLATEHCSDAQRLILLGHVSDGWCVWCGEVTNRCTCMRDE